MMFKGCFSMSSQSECVATIQALSQPLLDSLKQVVLGQDNVLELLVVGLLAEGHLLLEGVPGTAKTTLAKTVAKLINLDFRRIQLTPDMMPAEITGTSIYNLQEKRFEFQPGPVFCDLLLADELNRTPPKTQAALLEAMEEYQVTVEGQRRPLSDHFTVIATLNPIEFEGTYPLPEAQLDRFLMKITMAYPTSQAEHQLLKTFHSFSAQRQQLETSVSNTPSETTLFEAAANKLKASLSKEQLLAARRAVSQIHVEESIVDYILKIIQDTRQSPNIRLGGSPRAGLALLATARAFAGLQGQEFVTPDHVKAMAPHVLRHRLLLTVDAEMDGLNHDMVLKQTLNKVAVPR